MSNTKNEMTLALDIFNSIDFEKIKDHPNILVAANFWEPERYRAACVCYKILRQIDDLIDDHKAQHKLLTPKEQKCFKSDVERWLSMFMRAGRSNPANAELLETVEQFRVPLWPFLDFARSMIYDINHDGFATLYDFILYSQGATVAPAAIFVHLCGLRDNEEGGYLLPDFDVRDTATPCAIFSYLVHIIRDFQKDTLNNLSYFAADIMEKHGINVDKMRKMANGAPPSDGFRAMMHEYKELADQYREDTAEMIREVSPKLSLRHRLSLQIIFDLYLLVYERIDPENGLFTTEELVPTPAETRVRVRQVIERFFSLI